MPRLKMNTRERAEGNDADDEADALHGETRAEGTPAVDASVMHTRRMRLLRRYAQPKRAHELQTVEVVGEHTVCFKGALYDLRAGEKGERQPGFGFAPDGAWLEWRKQRDGTMRLEIVVGAASVPVTGTDGLSVTFKAMTNSVLLLEADARQPWLCIDRATGAPTGRLEWMQGSDRYGTRLYNSHVFDPRDGKTVWFVDGGAVVQVDLSTREPVRHVKPAAGRAFNAPTVAADGWWCALEEPAAGPVYGTPNDVVVFDASNRERARKTLLVNGSTSLTEGFVLFHSAEKRFSVVDRELNELESIAHDTDFARLVALPSGREWLAIGGHGEWDHFGADDLAPTSAEPAVKKPAARKPAPKKKKG